MQFSKNTVTRLLPAALALCALSAVSGCREAVSPETLTKTPQDITEGISREENSQQESSQQQNSREENLRDENSREENSQQEHDMAAGNAAGRSSGAAASGSLEQESQLALIADSAGTWAGDPFLGSGYWYAVTDLDQNGRLEIVTSILQGTGLYTTSYFYEVNESGDGLTALPQPNLREGDSQADIVTASVPAFYNPESGIYQYIFYDSLRNGASEYYESKLSLALIDGSVETAVLARSSVIADSETAVSVSTFQGADSVPLSEEEYLNIEDTVFAGWEKHTASLSWFGGPDLPDIASLSEEELAAQLQASLEGFGIS